MVLVGGEKLGKVVLPKVAIHEQFMISKVYHVLLQRGHTETHTHRHTHRQHTDKQSDCNNLALQD